jgi:DNA polymerase III delta subunit
MIILHGDQLVNSRKKLSEYLDQARQQQIKVVTLLAKKLTPAELEEKLGATSLFGDDQLTVIEELHSLPTSARKKQLIELLSNAAQDDQSQIIIWEKRSLTPTMLKKFAGATKLEFKLNKLLFKWLDTISGGKNSPTQQAQKLKSLHQVIEQESAGLVMMMLIRQIRLLLQVVAGGRPAGPPFIVNKLAAQAQRFSLAQLLSLHHELLKMDLNLKTSGSNLDLVGQLDLLALKL